VVAASVKKKRVWRVPPDEQMEHGLQGTVTLIERAVESNTRQVRICAELPNPDGKLLPGTTAMIVISPDEPWPLERFADGIHF